VELMTTQESKRKLAAILNADVTAGQPNKKGTSLKVPFALFSREPR
jgi:hypothetical protein